MFRRSDQYKSGYQRSSELLDAFAIIFAGSGGCFAVGCVIDDKSRTLKLIVASNNAIEQEKRDFVKTLWSLLLQIPVVLGTINLPQSLLDAYETVSFPKRHKPLTVCQNVLKNR